MSRRPVILEAAGTPGGLYGRRAVWAAMRKLRVFTTRQLLKELPQVSAYIIEDYAKALKKGGFIRPGALVKDALAPRARAQHEYELVRDVGVDAPRLRKDGTALPHTAQQQMWLVMKILGHFDATGLAAAASTASVPVSPVAAADYIKHLVKAGYLAGREGRYHLINDTGGLAPMVCRSKLVFDPNENRVSWHEEIEP